MILFDIGSAAWKLDEFKHELWEKSHIGIPLHDSESNDALILGNLTAWFVTSVSTINNTSEFFCPNFRLSILFKTKCVPPYHLLEHHSYLSLANNKISPLYKHI